MHYFSGETSGNLAVDFVMKAPWEKEVPTNEHENMSPHPRRFASQIEASGVGGGTPERKDFQVKAMMDKCVQAMKQEAGMTLSKLET